MAFAIPENIRSDKAVPAHHRRVATALLVGFDDETTVWYEPPFDRSGERPHFVVLDPTRGVIVVQVIDQIDDDPTEVLGHWRRRIRLRRGGQEIEVPDPLATARSFADAMAERLSATPETAHVPVAAMAALPYLTRADAEAEPRDLGSVLDLGTTLTKDAIEAINGGDETILLRVLGRLFGGMLDDDLDDRTLQLVRAVIHPDVVIGAPVSSASPKPAAAPASEPVRSSAAPTSPTDEPEQTLLDLTTVGEVDVLKVMDRHQERLAKQLGSGHRVIRGVAGSGKTLILLHRARMLATFLPDKRILVTCFTKSLASLLQAQLADLPNVDVINLDRLARSAVAGAGMLPKDGKIKDWEQLRRDAVVAMSRKPLPRYRAVMVDEAQDFSTEALQFCVALLEDEPGVESDLVIVADSAQNIFRRNFRWKDAGINAQGRTRILRTNYRNTRQILEFAYRFLTSDGTVQEADLDLDDETALIPAESTEREGPKPEVVPVADAKSERDAVVDQVRAWYRADLRPRSIAVLTPQKAGAADIVERLRTTDIPVFWTHEGKDNKDNKDKVGSADEPVVVSTVASSKGLEFPRVVVAGLNHNVPHEDVRKLLYVAFTRAIDELTVVADRSSPYTADL